MAWARVVVSRSTRRQGRCTSELVSSCKSTLRLRRGRSRWAGMWPGCHDPLQRRVEDGSSTGKRRQEVKTSSVPRQGLGRAGPRRRLLTQGRDRPWRVCSDDLGTGRVVVCRHFQERYAQEQLTNPGFRRPPYGLYFVLGVLRSADCNCIFLLCCESRAISVPSRAEQRLLTRPSLQ